MGFTLTIATAMVTSQTLPTNLVQSFLPVVNTRSALPILITLGVLVHWKHRQPLVAYPHQDSFSHRKPNPLSSISATLSLMLWESEDVSTLQQHSCATVTQMLPTLMEGNSSINLTASAVGVKSINYVAQDAKFSTIWNDVTRLTKILGADQAWVMNFWL